MKTFTNIYKWLVISMFAVLTPAISSNAQPSSCTPAPSGLVSWWRAEGNGLDSVGGNTAYAALLPDGVRFGPSEVGQGFQLRSTNAYLIVPASPSLNVGAGGSLTLEAWIYITNTDGYHPILEWNNSAGRGGVMLWILPTGTLFANLVDTNQYSHSFASSGGAVSANLFQHVALTYDRSTGIGTLYLNGATVAQANLGSFVPETTFNLWFGYRPKNVPGDATYGSYLGGSLDEVSIYNRALSSSEIEAISNAGSAGKCDGSTSGTAPIITYQPIDQTVNAGGNATFSVTATGSPTLHYQWYGPSSALILGATTPTLTLSNVQPSAAGAYFVLVTNQVGFSISSNAVLTVTGGGGGGTNSCTPLPSEAAAWWPAEGTGIDIVGGTTATLHGEATFAPGEVGQAFLLNGTNDYLTATGSNLDVAVNGSLTVEAWVKVSDIAGYHPIVEWDNGSGTAGVHLWILPYSKEPAGVLFANLVDSGGGSHSFHSPGGSVSANVFQHVALTYDHNSGVATMYVNGNIVSQVNFGQFTPQTSYPFFMGYRPNISPSEPTYGAHLGGLLDELSLYRRALNQSEIAAIYNAGVNGKCDATNSGTAPVVTYQPTNQTVIAGSPASFSVTATGTPPLHYQWFGPDGTPIPGATTSTLMLPNAQPSNAGSYYTFITNSFGFAQSSNAVLTVIGTAPVITYQPTNQTATVGTNVAFTVTATGTPTLHYQWYGPANALIPGATTATLILSNIQPSAAGAYFVLVTNQFGFAMGSNAVLTVTGPGGGTNSCTPSPSGLAAWWPAESNGVDIVGGATATLQGGATYAPGEVGQAFLLNGTNDYLSVSNLNFATNDSLTVEAWIKVSDVTDYHPIVEWNDGAGHSGTHLWILPYSGETPGVLYANIADTFGGSHPFHSPGGSISANVFQHVALTYDQASGVGTIYVNGNVVAQATLGSFTPQTSYPLWMGHRPNDPPENATYGAYLGGLLDELSLYRRALSQSEIAAIYNAGANGKCAPSQVVPQLIINPQPTVNLSTMGKSHVLSWPLSASDFTLQSADSLTPPIRWTNVPAALETNGAGIEVTLPEGNPQGYFRLVHPY